MFIKSKNPKTASQVGTAPLNQEFVSQDRNSVLSDWNVAPANMNFANARFENNPVSSANKKGYRICPKCLFVVPAAESKCVSCGYIKNNL